MKKQLLNIVTAVTLLSLPNMIFAQAPNLGTAADFVLFSTTGALTNTGISQLTGHVGSNSDFSTNFGNVNGVMNDKNGASSLCADDLLTAYNQLDLVVPTATLAPAIGNGQTLTSGVYYIPSASTLDLVLTLDGLGNSNSVFIFKVQGPLSTTVNSKVKLINSAKACNVYWKVEGLVDMAAGTSMKGTIIANNSAINMSTGDTLEGRALTTAGAITIDGILAYTPIGCNSPVLNGPSYPNLGSAACYGVFSGNGPVTNTGNTFVTGGDVGTNVTLTTGFNPLNVTGMVHPIPDGSTAACAADLSNLYTYLNTLPNDIELLYPAQFGRSLVLTPHTYIMKAATVFTDTLYLNALDNPNAVFVIKINGALSTSTYAKVALINGALAKNVFWKVDGAVSINNFADFKGTIIANNGAVSINKGVLLNGRAMTTDGELTTDSIRVIVPVGSCSTVGINDIDSKNIIEIASFYPNPMTNSLSVLVTSASESNPVNFSIYNTLGTLVMSKIITEQSSVIETNLPSGIYFYKVITKNNKIQSGKLMSQQ
ncbi:MAG: DUF3494 domain-containing protein [Bacteroidia bacterium]|nr:DUF3494 domain-containing protein [Bacteroidia bacterium]